MIAQDDSPAPSNVDGTGTSLVQMGRAWGGFEGVTSDTVWYSRSTGQACPAFPFRLYKAERYRWKGYGTGNRQAVEDESMARVVREGGIVSKFCIARVHYARLKREGPPDRCDKSATARRAVADLSHLSEHYDKIHTTNTTLEGFSASLLPGDHLISMDLSSGYNHFRLHPDMRKYFTVSVQFANGEVRYFQYIALPFGWSRSGYWFCRLVERFWTMVRTRLSYRVLSYVDDFAIAPSMGRAATANDCRKASAKLGQLLNRYGLTRHPEKGVWGSGSQTICHLGFMIDTIRGTFGVPEEKVCALQQQSKKLLDLARRNRRRVPKQELARFIGKAQSLRLAVPETAFRLRALYDCLGSDCLGQTERSSSGRRWGVHVRSTLSHAAIRDVQYWHRLGARLTHRPIWPNTPAPTMTVHTDSSLTAYGATLAEGAQRAGTKGFFEVQGYWDPIFRETAHITILELMTVRLTLEEFVKHCLIKEDEIIRLFTDNQVVSQVVTAMCSKSPQLMAELRRLREFLRDQGVSLQMEFLPSALNLYADRLSRRRRYNDYLPELAGIPSHWWAGESEHDFKLSWSNIRLLRPPLEFLPLVRRKIEDEGFQGLLLVPRWPRQNWHQELLQDSCCHRVLPAAPDSHPKRWAATLMAFGTRGLGLMQRLHSHRTLQEDSEALHPMGEEAVVGWRKVLTS